MTTLFPRGGNTTNQSTTFNGKKRTIEDNLFGNQSSRTKRIEVISNKKKRKEDVNTNSTALPTMSNIGLGMTHTIANNKILKIDHITFTKLNTGCLVIGYILQINTDRLVISLPGSSTGMVAHHEVSDVFYKMKMTQQNDTRKVKLPELSTVVTPLQMVRCYVLDQVLQSEDSQKKIIRLSMRASLINRGLTMKNINAGMPIYGCIASKEDHGYIVAGGISGCNFFLPSKAIPASKGELMIGQPIECVCTASNDTAQTATLRAHPKAVYEAITMSGSLAFTSLIPGMQVKVVIDKIVENGVLVNFLGMFYGAIDTSSLASPCVGSDWNSTIKEGDTYSARIVLVDYATKTIRLSLRPHVLEMRPPRFLPALGEIVENLIVASASKSTGVLCIHMYKPSDQNNLAEISETTLIEDKKDSESAVGKKRKSAAEALALKQKREEDEHKLPVFINKSTLAGSLDSTQEESSEVIDTERILKVYKVGSSIPSARVKGYNLVEGLVVASNLSSYIGGTVVHSSDVKVGQLLAVEVIAIKDFGLVVKINGGRVTAICPTLHSADVVIEGSGSKLKKKFKVGQELHVRVWEVSSSGIIVTNKKSMVDLNDDEDEGTGTGLLTSYSCKQASIGNIVTGVISGVSPKGIDVRFFNKARGIVPMVVLAKQGVLDPLEAYRPGAILKGIIIGKVVAENVKSVIYLALNISKDKKAILKLMESVELPQGVTAITSNEDQVVSNRKIIKSEESSKTQPIVEDANQNNELVSGEVYKIEEDYALVRLDNGKTGKIQKYHFFDLASTSEVLFNHMHSEIKVGMHIKNALILYYQKGIYVLTLKPLLIEAIKSSTSSTASSDVLHIPSRVADLSPGQIVAGYIVKVDTYGVIVRFKGNMSALAPRPNIADKFISTPVGIFSLGDSMRCAVQRVDLSTDKAIVTFKSSVISPSSGSISYLHTILRERYLKASAVTLSTKKVFPDWKRYSVGSVVKVVVSSIEEYGVVLLADDNTTILFARNVSTERLNELVVDKSVKALILDIDFENGVLLVSLETTFTKNTVTSDETGVTPLSKSKKKKTIINSNTTVNIGEKYDAQIVLVQNGYLVVFLLKTKLLGYVMLADYHNPTPSLDSYEIDHVIAVKAHSIDSIQESEVDSYPHKKQSIFTLFQEHEVQRARLVSNLQTSNDNLFENSHGLSVSSVKQKIIDQLRVGQRVEWVVKEIEGTQMTLSPVYTYDESEIRIKAFVHVTNAIDPYKSNDNLHEILQKKSKAKKTNLHSNHPFYKHEVGKKIWCHVLQVRRESFIKSNESIEEYIVYLSISIDSDLDTLKQLGFPSAEDSSVPQQLPFFRMTQSHGKDDLKCPSLHAVVVTKLEEISCIVAFSPYLTARLNYIDTSSDPELIELFMKKCFVGLRLIVAVTGIVKENQKVKNIRVSRVCIEFLLNNDSTFDITKARGKLSSIQEPEYEEGLVVNALLNFHSSKIPKPPAINVSLPGNKLGRVCITEIWDHENWSDLSAFFQKQQQDQSSNGLIEDIVLPGGYKHGSIVQARILEVSTGYVELSLRPSRINEKKVTLALKPDTIPIEGAVIPAYVVNISNKGCFLRLSTGITGKVLMRDLADEFVKDPEALYPIGKLCQARLLSISQIDSMAKLSLKDSAVIGDQKAKSEILNIKIGDTVTGTVQRVTQEGVFILLENTSLVGLSRKAAALVDMNKTLIEEYEVGDVVRCKVLSVSKTSLKVGLGLRPSYFRKDNEKEESEEEEESNVEEEYQDTSMEIEENNEDNEEYDDDDDDENSEEEEDDENSEEEEDDSDAGTKNIRMLDEGDDGSDSEIENMIKAAALSYESNSDSQEDKEVINHKQSNKKKPRMKDIDDNEDDEPTNIFSNPNQRHADMNEDDDILGDLPWDESIPLWNNNTTKSSSKNKNNIADEEESSDDEDDESDDDGDDENNKGKSKGLRTRQKESLRRKLEQSIREREIALENGSLLPETKDDYERLLIAQPNSSYLWIQYMAFYLQSAAIEPARAIAARALRIIDYREDDEKYNVWIALLNMEHKYGSMETLEKAFTRAISESKGKQIYLAMANTYEQAKDLKGAEVIYNKALKRPQFKKSKKVWIAYHQFKLRVGDIIEAKTQLSRSLQSLSKHKHIEVISKYAMAEYEYGLADRGRIVFEELLINYPKRTDIWNLYIDKEIKHGFIIQARQLFDRMIHSKHNSHTMKVIFKKYVEFEVIHGTEQTQEAVRQKARDYVNSIA